MRKIQGRGHKSRLEYRPPGTAGGPRGPLAGWPAAAWQLALVAAEDRGRAPE